MLSHIRKPYLNVDTRPHASRQQTRTLDFGTSEESWSSIRWLTNEERDQIDMQARVILTKCADRVKGMEALETRTKSSLYNDQRNLKNRRLQMFLLVVRQSGDCYQPSEPAREVPSCEIVAGIGSSPFIGLCCRPSYKHHLVPEPTAGRSESSTKGNAGSTGKASVGEDAHARVRSSEGGRSHGSPILHSRSHFRSGTVSRRYTRGLARKRILQFGFKLGRNHWRQLELERTKAAELLYHANGRRRGLRRRLRVVCLPDYAI